MSTLDIVIVNWNAGGQLRACLASIPRAVRDDVALSRVVVVDNASTDRSADGLEGLGLPLVVIRNVENRGFAAACNQGAARSSADHLLFLNPDTELFEDSLSRPMAYLDQPEQGDVGVCGVQLIGDDGAVARSSVRFPTARSMAGQALGLDRVLPAVFPSHFMSDWDHADTRVVDQVIGAFFWVRRALFEQLGGFDERFFVYYEELDLARRVAAAGYRTVFLADARAYHRGGGTSDQAKAARLFFNLRSRLLYAHKHFGRTRGAALALLTLGAEPFARVALHLARGDLFGAGETIRGYRRLWAQGLALVAGRVQTVP